mmetsp:Transcript_3739/g.4157  ORF Transcript_3739/g.4157 Transcript_3739/m.4157 type:complete len:91 (-) Transcript_3739:217-489(-)
MALLKSSTMSSSVSWYLPISTSKLHPLNHASKNAKVLHSILPYCSFVDEPRKKHVKVTWNTSVATHSLRPHSVHQKGSNKGLQPAILRKK